MHQLLTDGAAREPDKIAFRWVDRNKTLTYAQSVEATEHFADALHHLGVRVGDRVTIFAHNGLDYFTLYWVTTAEQISAGTYF
jgi:long-chain acyl-CoA synthetase